MATGRFHPLWWPVFGLASPGLVPWLAWRTGSFRRRASVVAGENARRIEAMTPLDLPEVDRLDLTVVVDHAALGGFMGAPGVSWLFETELGRLLVDVGFGPEHPSLEHNARALGISGDHVDALVITHLHLDHMGGMEAQKARRVTVPERMAPHDPIPCFLPDEAAAPGFIPSRVRGPGPLACGWGTTGPLARSLFFTGRIEEQALVLHVRDRGLVVVTGCGHPGLSVILRAARRLVDAPLYALIGGLHYPITRSRSRRMGVDVQRLFGTGKAAHEVLDDTDLDMAIEAIRDARPELVLISAHDTCDYAIERFRVALDGQVRVLTAGETLTLGA